MVTISRICEAAGCDAPLTPRQQRFHSRECQLASYEAARQGKKVRRRLDGVDPNSVSGYRGQLYELLIDTGIGRQALSEGRTHVWVGDQVQKVVGKIPARTTISASMRAVAAHYADAEAAAAWEQSFTIRWMLMSHRPQPPASDRRALDAWLDEAVGSFVAFEERFWKLSNGRPYIRKPVHRVWVRAILSAIATGGQLMILSPPRHGKTELLQHFCVWLICRDPNARIIWVGPNGDIAKETVGAIREMLESDDLIDAVLGPGKAFRPATRAASKWSDARFTVATRTVVGMKAPTLTAQGKGAKILSKDADLIIGDDLEDYDSTETAGQREAGRTWFMTQLESRKQIHTAWFCIGSRQHPDDLWGYLLDDPSWETIVNSAHDPDCPHDRERIELHTDCMLFGEINPYAWLYTKWVSARARGQEHLYEMVYLNNPRPEGTVHWTRELVARSFNHNRGLGLSGLWSPTGESRFLAPGSDFYLVGGLDPSAVGYQAAFCWGMELIYPDTEARRDPGFRQWMVDLDNHLGGGVDAFIDGPGDRWLKSYGLRHWVVEDNLFRQVFSKHERLVAWAGANGIIIEPIQTTGVNKWDKVYGVGAMRQLWVEDPPRVDLPYGDPEARHKSEIYLSQLLRYTDDPSKLRRRITDVLMSSWFPQRTMLRMFNEMLARITDQGWFEEFSHPEYDRSDYNQPPW